MIVICTHLRDVHQNELTYAEESAQVKVLNSTQAKSRPNLFHSYIVHQNMKSVVNTNLSKAGCRRTILGLDQRHASTNEDRSGTIDKSSDATMMSRLPHKGLSSHHIGWKPAVFTNSWFHNHFFRFGRQKPSEQTSSGGMRGIRRRRRKRRSLQPASK